MDHGDKDPWGERRHEDTAFSLPQPTPSTSWDYPTPSHVNRTGDTAHRRPPPPPAPRARATDDVLLPTPPPPPDLGPLEETIPLRLPGQRDRDEDYRHRRSDSGERRSTSSDRDERRRRKRREEEEDRDRRKHGREGNNVGKENNVATAVKLKILFYVFVFQFLG